MNFTTVTATTTPAFSTSTLTTYTLPDFNRALEQALTDCLRAGYRGVDFEFSSAWLVCHERSEGPDATVTVRHSHALLASLTEHFTGHFRWDNVALAGLYATASPAPETSSIDGLGRDDLAPLYAAVAAALPERYKQLLSDHWAETQPTGKSRRDEFLAERVQLLRLEGQMRVEQGEFGSYLYAMLNEALDFGTDTSPDPLQKHGVFSLSVGADASAMFALTGAFVITEQRSDQRPAMDDESLGEVLLYTPADSLERFDSLKQLTATLAQRLADGEQRRRLLGHLTHDDALALTNPATHIAQPDIAWQLLKLGNNFMSLLLTSQILKQKADFDHAVKIARSLQLNERSFKRLMLDLMSSEKLFDNHRHERQLDCTVVREQMPGWWQSMDERQRAEWTENATGYADAISLIRRMSHDHFNAPMNNGAHAINAYIDATLAAALAEKNISASSRQIQVAASFRTSLPQITYPLTTLETDTQSRTFSLHQLAHEHPHLTKIGDARELSVADEQGVAIPGISGDFVTDVLARIETPAKLEEYLAQHLDRSTYAAQLKAQHRRLLSARLRMAYLECQQNGFPTNRLSWIAAVLDGPDAQVRAPLDAGAIEVQLLCINGMKIPDIMLIAPSGKFERGPLVLCTLNAPDNIVFRAFNSMFHLRHAFLEEDQYKSYIAQLLPYAQTRQGLVMLDYSKWLKHWRFPDVLTSLQGPLPVPSLVMNPIVFRAQTKDLFDEHFESKIQQLKDEAKARLLQRNSGARPEKLDLVMSIALLLLPAPVMIPLALGMGLSNAWSGFHKIDENDWDGAAQEFLSAASYLVVAGVGALGTAAAPDPRAALVRRPHLVRRMGRDGQVQIGYLLSPASAPCFVESGMMTQMDPDKFVEVALGTDAGYVARRFNLFGRSRLYRRYARDASLLIHEDEYVVRSSTGAWTKVEQPLVRLSKQTDRQARHDLGVLLNDWPTATPGASPVEPSLDEALFTSLAGGSKAELYPEVLDYIEGGSARINHLLRSGTRSPQVRDFLDQFYRLKSWWGHAFRAAHVTEEGLQRLRSELGAVFVDAGVQSASISRSNALRWSRDHFVTDQAQPGTHPVFFIFAPSIPKKNLFSDFLGDHVGIAPGTRLQLSAFRQNGSQAFAYFTAPERIAFETFDLFNGERELFVRQSAIPKRQACEPSEADRARTTSARLTHHRPAPNPHWCTAPPPGDVFIPFCDLFSLGPAFAKA